MYAGIDYGMGKTNVDVKTGIRFGVISQNSVLQAWADSAEADYGEPEDSQVCPHCGEEWEKPENAGPEVKLEWLDTLECTYCEEEWEVEFPDCCEPIGWTLDDGEYKAVDCLGSDIMILSSPYYTLAQYCSPCCPGAGNLDCAMDGGHKTYWFGHGWFDGGTAPYPVYSVETGELVEP